MNRRGKLVTLAAVVLLVGGAVAYYSAFLDPGWVGPAYYVTDGDVKDDGCWEITAISQPRKLMRPDGSHEVLEIKPVYWSEIEVRQVERTQAHGYNEDDELPEGQPIPHGQTGTVEVGEVACTGRVPQLWLYTPSDPPHVAAFISCFEC